MKKFFILLLTFLLTGPAIFAQSPQKQSTSKPKIQANQKKSDLNNDLHLSQDQQNKLNAIQADTKAKVATIRSNASLTEEQKQQQMLTLMQSCKQKYEAILTPTQQAQLKSKAKAERKDRGNLY